MSFDNALSQLTHQLVECGEILIGLHVTVTQDGPGETELKLVDMLGTAIDDIIGHQQEALDAAFQVHRARAQQDWNLIYEALCRSQKGFSQLLQQYLTDFFTFDRFQELVDLGRTQNQQWLAWVRTIGQTLDLCAQQLTHVNEAYVFCWQAWAGRQAQSTVSVRNILIGQNMEWSETMKNESGVSGQRS